MQNIACYMSSTHMLCKKDWVECVRWAKRVDFDGVEFFQGENGVNFVDLPEARCAEVGRVAAKLGVKVAVHPWVDYCQKTEDEMIYAYTGLMRRCLSMGAKEINMHLHFLANRKQGVARVITATDAVLPLIQEAGATLLYENVPDHNVRELGSEAKDFEQLFTAYGMDVPVKLNIDVGHAHMMRNLQPLAEDFGSRWQYTHINDNDGLADLHVAPSDGTLDFDLLAHLSAQCGYSGPLMMEYNERGLPQGMRTLYAAYEAQGYAPTHVHID